MDGTPGPCRCRANFWFGLFRHEWAAFSVACSFLGCGSIRGLGLWHLEMELLQGWQPLLPQHSLVGRRPRPPVHKARRDTLRQVLHTQGHQARASASAPEVGQGPAGKATPPSCSARLARESLCKPAAECRSTACGSCVLSAVLPALKGTWTTAHTSGPGTSGCLQLPWPREPPQELWHPGDRISSRTVSHPLVLYGHTDHRALLSQSKHHTI